MKILSGAVEYFALDIGATGVRAVELTNDGTNWSLSRFGAAPVDIRLSNSDAPEDQRKLGEVILNVIAQSGIRTKNVILGAPSSKVFATVVELPDMPNDELATTIKYQADQYIPTSVEESKIDWAILGKPSQGATNNEVLLASVTNNFVESRLDMIEGLGLNVIAIEPDSIALVRSLQPEAAPEGKLIIELGDFSSDIIMTFNGAPHLIRSVQTGAQSFYKTAAQNLNVEQKQAQQFIQKFGLQRDKLEGQVFRAIESTADQFIGEIEKSIKFFQTKYPTIPVNGMIVSNYAATIPGFKEYVTEKLGLAVQVGNPWQKVRVNASDQTKLQPLMSQFGVVIGLAQRGSE